jgi:dienelactone hydrolase
MRIAALFALSFIALTATSEAAVKTQVVKYKHGSQECHGYLAWDDAIQGQRPGVLVVHEWWGLNDYAKKRAEELAKLGYAAFCADMYGDGKVVDHPKDAMEMTGKLRANVDDWRKRAQEALATLKAQPQCDPDKVAAIGYCFGGSTCLQLAMTGADLKAVATFHAGLPKPTAEEAKKIKAKVLVCNGADDKFIPADAIAAFRQELDTAKTNYEFVNYPGAVHSFTVPDADKVGNPGMKYQKAADEDSWKKLLDLLAATVGKKSV